MNENRKFDTKVQVLKYKVLREVARLAWEDKLLDGVMDIPGKIVPGNIPTMRCCVYKERAIFSCVVPSFEQIFIKNAVCNPFNPSLSSLTVR